MASFQAHLASLSRIKQSPYNDNHVATCSDDSTVKIWDISSLHCWTLIRYYTNHASFVRGLEFMNADTIVSGSFDQTVKIWSISSGDTIRSINVEREVDCLKLVKNGSQLAVGLRDFSIKIYNSNDGTLITTLSGHTSYVQDLIYISESDLLASSGGWNDNTIRIWNLTTNVCKFILKGHTNDVWGLKLISNDLLASGSSDGTIRLWNITTGQSKRTLTSHTRAIKWSIDLTNSGQTIVSGGSDSDQTIKLWDLKTGNCLNTINTGFNIFSLSVLERHPLSGFTLIYYYANSKMCDLPLRGETTLTGSYQIITLTQRLKYYIYSCVCDFATPY